MILRKLRRLLYHKTTIKQHDKPLKILFLIQNTPMWNIAKQIYLEGKDDPFFSFEIMILPPAHLKSDAKVTQLFEEIKNTHSFLDENGVCLPIHYSINQKGKPLDPLLLKPDIIFYFSPYSSQRNKLTRPKNLGRYANLFYVNYGFLIMNGDVESIVYKRKDFFQNFNTICVESHLLKQTVLDLSGTTPNQILVSGYPKLDAYYKKMHSHNSYWNFPETYSKYRIIWNPRWSVKQGTSHFTEYIHLIIDFLTKNQTIDFVFRPHPNLFRDMLAHKLINKTDKKNIYAKFDELPNARIDDAEGDYLSAFASSDLLISDISSLMAEYFPTGKPIIYTKKKEKLFNNIGEALSSGFYHADSWDIVLATLNKLQAGDDPLKKIRNQIIKEHFPCQSTSSNLILKHIKKIYKE